MKLLHPGTKWSFRLRSFTSMLFLAAVIFIFVLPFLQVTVNNTFFFSLTNKTIIFVFCVIILTEIFARLTYNAWKYELKTKEVTLEMGVIRKIYKSIPYTRVQNVELHRGIIARMLGFSTIIIQTAGYSGGGSSQGRSGAEGSIPGVSTKEAEKIRTFIMKKIGNKAGV